MMITLIIKNNNNKNTTKNSNSKYENNTSSKETNFPAAGILDWLRTTRAQRTKQSFVADGFHCSEN